MKLEKVEAKIGICFQDRSLLAKALTHRSYAQNTGDSKNHNERLEFLGDAILGILIVDYLYHHFPNFEVGKLAPLRDKLVSNTTLVKFANQVGLRDFILLGRGEALNRVRENSKQPFAGAFEALLGAVYLDLGFNAAQNWLIKQFIEPELKPELKHLNICNQSKPQLKFLGNAILKAIAANYVYLNFPALDEGNLTHLREKLICKPNLVKFEHQIRPGEFISPADTLKELIAMIYLRQSFPNTYSWFLNRFIYQYKID